MDDGIDLGFIDPVAGNRLIGTPAIVRSRAAGKRRSHRDDLGDLVRMGLCQFARHDAPQAPSDQIDGRAGPAIDIDQTALDHLEPRLGGAEIIAQPPFLGDVPGLFQLARHPPHTDGMGAKPGQQHHGLRSLGRRDLQRRAYQTAQRFDRPQEFPQHQLPARSARVVGAWLGGQRPTSRDFLAVRDHGVFER